MSNDLKKAGLFLDEILKRLKGDDEGALASKISRKAISAIDSQIAGLQSKIVDAELDVENAEDALQDAIFPAKLFTSNKEYCQGIINAQDKLDEKKAELDALKKDLEYFRELLGENNTFKNL
jgi:hypothetical protein